jgi:DNA-binding response OmpR family regulator
MSNKPNVLLVDDSEQNRYVVARHLHHAEFAVQECATGADALKMALQNPDLIILDVKLPDISGYEVCRRLKLHPATASIPILQISAAFTSNNSKATALEAGADGYLTHPVDSNVLITTVRSLLKKQSA